MTGGTIAATPLQLASRSLFSVLLDARDGLDDREYSAYLSIACCRLAREVARIADWRRAA